MTAQNVPLAGQHADDLARRERRLLLRDQLEQQIGRTPLADEVLAYERWLRDQQEIGVTTSTDHGRW